MRVLLACAAGRQVASPAFLHDFYQVRLPEGSARCLIRGAHVEMGINTIINSAIEQHFDYIFYMDDDFRCESDVVLRCLQHGKDRVSPIITERLPPFRPYVFDRFDGEVPHFLPVPPTQKGLWQVPMIAGCPGLMATAIFRQLPFPWFPPNEFLPQEGVPGDVKYAQAWRQGDMGFTRKLAAHGVRSYIDLDQAFGHEGTYQVRHHYDLAEQRWRTALITPEGTRPTQILID